MENKQQLMERVFTWVETAAKNIGDFAQEQIPPFIHEFLQWKFLEAAIDISCWVAFWSGPVVAVLIAALIGRKRLKKDGYADEHTQGLFGCAGTVLGLILIFGAISFPSKQIKDMIQIKVAPKVYLVEKAAEIIQKAK